MVGNVRFWLSSVLLIALYAAGGCQVNNSSREIRSDEQMLPVSFENARAEELFMKAVRTTSGQEQNVKRVGLPELSVYSRSETVAWNANCNDHIRRMDKDENLIITEQEAQTYYDSITSTKSLTGGE